MTLLKALHELNQISLNIRSYTSVHSLQYGLHRTISGLCPTQWSIDKLLTRLCS